MSEKIDSSAETAEPSVGDSLAILLPNAPDRDRRPDGGRCGSESFSDAVVVLRSRSNGQPTKETDRPRSSCRVIEATVPSPSVLAEVLRCTVTFSSTASTLEAFIGLALETGPWCAGSVTSGQSPELLSTVAFLGRRAADCDHLQRQFGEGPSRDAMSATPLQVAGDLDCDRRWPQWAARANSGGVHAVMSMRLFTNITLGTLNLYAAAPFRIDAGVTQAVQVIAAHASTVIGHLRTEQQLRHAVKSRTVIGQAEGMLMQRFGLTADKAFGVLRRISQDNNVKIAVLAEELVATGNIQIVDLTLNN